MSYVDKDKEHFRYVFEPRQGVSFARNTGIAAARGDLMVFTDDDIEFDPTWVQENYRASLRFPEADFFGGRVLPIWPSSPPSWIKQTMYPFALSNLGDEAIRIEPPGTNHCLVGASLAIRRRAFDKAGLFSIATQRVKNGIGSTEDWDWEVKVWEYGGHGMYIPEIVCHTRVPKNRLRKNYHRRWHAGNGKFHAISGRNELLGSRRCLNVPLFIYRQAAEAARQAFSSRIARQERAFADELKFWYYTGVIRHHWATWLRSPKGTSYVQPTMGRLDAPSE